MQRSVGLIVDCEEVTRAPGMQELVERKIVSQEHGDYVILNLDTGTIPPLHPHTPSAGQRQGRGIKLLTVSVQRRYQTAQYQFDKIVAILFECSGGHYLVFQRIRTEKSVQIQVGLTLGCIIIKQASEIR